MLPLLLAFAVLFLPCDAVSLVQLCSLKQAFNSTDSAKQKACQHFRFSIGRLQEKVTLNSNRKYDINGFSAVNNFRFLLYTHDGNISQGCVLRKHLSEKIFQPKRKGKRAVGGENIHNAAEGEKRSLACCGVQHMF